MTHDYYVDLIDFSFIKTSHTVSDNAYSSILWVEVMLDKLKTASELTQILMIIAQQLQEKYINIWKDLTEDYCVDEEVWLNLCNVNTNQLSKKLNAQHWKFKILKRIDSHVYCLNIFFEIHNVFHIWLLYSVVMNSLLS